ncbi:MAG: hypothetical protein RLZZ238_537 [Planctomycetota bacterium]|jgi:hypothetical protein
MAADDPLSPSGIGGGLALGAGIACALGVSFLLAWLRVRRRSALDEAGRGNGPTDLDLRTPTFDERPLPDVERTLEALIAKGVVEVEPATGEDRARARVPSEAGPVFRAFAGRYRSVRLVEAEVSIELHRGSIAEDAIGGWRFDADPSVIDIRLASRDGADTGDRIVDATWSPGNTREVAVHSTIVHFVVRAAAGDGTE